MRSSCTYNISGTKTFRLSSSKILRQWGENLQNKEKGMRIMYVPDNGKIFVQVDQSGAEALIVAYLCKNGNFRKLFTNNIKPHVFVALHIFSEVWKKKLKEKGYALSEGFNIDDILNLPIDKLRSHPDWNNLDHCIKDSDNWSLQERYYYLAKQACHSGNYSITAPTFRLNVLEKSGGKIVISKEDAEKFVNTYNSLFPEIREWHEQVRIQVEMHSMLFNLHGEPYTITTYNILESSWKELYAWIPQSSVGMITNIAYSNQQTFIEVTHKQNTVHQIGLLPEIVVMVLDTYGSKPRYWDILANTHDSYLDQALIGEEIECSQIMKQFINQKFTSPVDGVEFSMKSEAVAGFNWSPAKKDGSNPEGLKEI